MTKLNWGMIGGGEGSQIGPAHRLGAQADGLFSLDAGALDADAEKGRDFAMKLGVSKDRAYANWKEMLERESTSAGSRHAIFFCTLTLRFLARANFQEMGPTHRKEKKKVERLHWREQD